VILQIIDMNTNEERNYLSKEEKVELIKFVW
jgi:hypothetical protein